MKQHCERETYTQCCPYFRSLTADECEQFRLAAQENYETFSPIDPLWHPIFRDECEVINKTNYVEEAM